MPIIESIPNVSEGRRPDVVERIADAVRATPGRARCSTIRRTRSHNRSVFTLAGDASRVKAAILALFEAAVAAIDLRTHHGEHPRLGAVDVVPFVPIEGVTMAECVALAKDVGAAVAERFGVPVYLYEEASANPARKNLEDIRRGEFEGLAAKMASPGWAPDFGPAAPHPSAGASRHRRAHAAHRLQHQPRTPTGSTSRRRSPPRSATAAAACATSRRWASSSRIATSRRCR